MEIRFHLTEEDVRIFFEHATARKRGFGPTSAHAAITGSLAGIGLAIQKHSGYFSWPAVSLLLTAGLFAASYIATVIWRRFGKIGGWLKQFAGEQWIIVTPTGVSASGKAGPAFISWPEIHAFEETGGYWYLYLSPTTAFIVPKRAFSDPAAGAEFAGAIRGGWSGHPDNRRRTLPGRPGRKQGGLRAVADLWANCCAGYRFAVLRRVDIHDFKSGGVQLCLLLVAELLLFGTFDYFSTQPEPRFNVYGLVDFSARVVLLLLSGLAIAGLLAGMGSMIRLLTVITAAELAGFTIYFPIYAAYRELSFEPRWYVPLGLYIAWTVWSLSFVLRAVVMLYGYPRPAALLPVSIFVLFNLAAETYLPDQHLFYSSRDEESGQSADARRIDGEDLFYRQPLLVQGATEQLVPQRPGVTDLYFIGFAGQADEHVFANETEYARNLFDQRFDTAGRSIALINSPDTMARAPIANIHNLETVLQSVSKHMNPEEDLLFLFLTSHGSKDHRLSVQFWPLPLNDLPATRLKEMLDRSGIRHRVIVVSACYSGGFLDTLKDDNSLILTAASRDRTSFGCGTEADFTYFGEAYFVKALHDTRSFIEAFGKARAMIEVREKGEGKEPSLPQLHVGTSIVPKLKAFEARLKAHLQDDLHADLNHPVGRNAEEVDGAGGVAGHADEQLEAP